MCGITGWIDFDRDLRQEGAAVDAMTETMACRGPDARGIWIREHAALGHRRLAVIDVEGGRQPMAAEGGAVLTYSGEVYNFREQREELEALGHRFLTRSDTEVVLRAYLAWGPDFVQRLNGMFAFAIWDERRERLLLARDRLGIKPLYYAPRPGGVLFGSEPKAILANPGFEAAVDEEGLRQVLGWAVAGGGSVWRGVRQVAPGTCVVVDRSGCRTHVYWRLEAVPHEDDLETTVRTVRELLDDIVGRQLISDVPLCTLLSGGLDSSAMTALAAEQLRRLGEGPVRSFAVDFEGYTEGFTADALRESPDAPFVREVAAHVESDHQDVVLDSAQLMAPAARAAVLHAYDAPVGLGDMNTSLYLLFRAIREHSTVALSGESADEVFGGYAWFHDERAVQADTFPWLAMLARGRTMRGTLLRPELEQRLDLRNALQESYRTALADVPHLDGEDARERRMREVCHLHLTHFLPRLLDRKDRMSMAVGLEVRVPFCDHRLVQYVFNTPWSMKTFDGREKSLLRAATADLLPLSVVERRKSPYPSTQDPAYGAMLRGEVGRVLADPASPVFEILDRSRVEAMVARWGEASGGGQFRRLGLEQVLSLNGWMTDYRPRLLL